jgi:Protein of unknown function (DUF2946)
MLHRDRRGIFACLLAYALVLQSFIFAVTAGRAMPGSADDTPWAAELCSHHGDATGAAGAPSQPPAGDKHCLFCIAGALYVACAPLTTPQYLKKVLGEAIAPLKAPPAVALLINENAWPRGPPATV